MIWSKMSLEVAVQSAHLNTLIFRVIKFETNVRRNESKTRDNGLLSPLMNGEIKREFTNKHF